jgi:hypothetical protein
VLQHYSAAFPKTRTISGDIQFDSSITDFGKK